MPIFRFGKAFSTGWGAKAFLNLQSGITRGAVPDLDQYEKQVEKLRNARKLMKEQRNQIKGQAENLKYARLQTEVERKARRSKDRGIFQLKKELRAAKEQVKGRAKDWLGLAVGSEREIGALPDFVIIGAPKCGTTSLHELLTQHPHVESGLRKELGYFTHHFDKGIEWYRAQFLPPMWKNGQRSVTGESTPSYFFDRSVPEKMAKVIPQARLIALLRNPVDRAYSNYQQNVRTVKETRTFEDAIKAEMKWLLGKEGGVSEQKPDASVGRTPAEYLQRSIYVDHFTHWLKYFGNEQVLVLKSEDIFERELDTLKIVLNFLDLPDWEPEVLEKRNKNQGHYKQEMDPVTRRQLEDFFEPHNRRLYEYLGVDFGW